MRDQPDNSGKLSRQSGSEPTEVSADGAGAQAPMDFLAPAQAAGELGRLGTYRILKVLGAGGMGMVFQAEDTHLKRVVALKVMLPAATAKASARERFLREARASAALEHDNIVTIYQVGEDRGIPFLAMQLLKGRSLEDALREGQALSLGQILRLAREVALGLAAAHARGLVHRDIKPANIFLETRDEPATSAETISFAPGPLTRTTRVKILDFGLARASTDDSHLTLEGTIVGSPSYMSPEQARSGDIDHRSDLFSLGCVLYRLCTGHLPFRGKDLMSKLMALASEQPVPVRSLNPDLPAPLAELIHQLLAKDPQDRPQSASSVAEILRFIDRAQPEYRRASAHAVAAQASASGPSEATAHLEPASRAPAITQDAGSPGRWLPWIGVALGALALLGLAYFQFMRPPAVPEPLAGKKGPARSKETDKAPVSQPPIARPAIEPVKKPPDDPPGPHDAATISKSLLLEKLQVLGGPHHSGDVVLVSYQVRNVSGKELRLPGPKPWFGTRQHWIERLGDDPVIPGRQSAKQGRKYAAGGWPVILADIVGRNESFSFTQKIPTGGFPPGPYRIYVELRLQNNPPFQTGQIEFLLLPARKDAEERPR